MRFFRRASIYLLATALGCFLPAMYAQTAATTVSFTARDGQHDFDFNIGTWNTHIRRLVNPLSGSNEWTEMNGTVAVQPIWNGRAQLEQIDAEGPAGGLQGLTLFLYNPKSHQWGMTFSNAQNGTVETPSVGEFKDGRGEFYDTDTYNGRAIIVRQVWSDITPDSHRFEQAFSDDGGRTWETNFIATLTRKNP